MAHCTFPRGFWQEAARYGPAMRRVFGCVVSVLLLLMGGVVLALPASAAQVPLMAFARGDQQVPGPGDPDGLAVGQFQVDDETNELCYTIGAVGITLPATSAHIHEAPVGVAGDSVVTLDETIVNDTFEDDVCQTIDPVVADAIAAAPSGFYLDVHTSDFPDGAVRGQLETPPEPEYLEATGDGAEVVPGPGDPDGEVDALLAVYADDGLVCAIVEAEGITLPAVDVDVHLAPSGVTGPSVVGLDPDSVGTGEGTCVDADPAVLAAMIASPENHYLDIHTSDFPDGAVRGQLAAGQPFEPIPTPAAPPTASPATTVALPRSVPAGSGGQAAGDAGGSPVGVWLIAAGGVLAVVSVSTWRRRGAQTGSAKTTTLSV
jgi:hypothetical protein